MSNPAVQRIEEQLVPLLRSLETLQLIARYLNPPELADLLETVGTPDETLREARLAEPWPEPYPALGKQLDEASAEALAAFDGLRAHATDPGGVRELFRAMRHIPRALEALYPLSGILPPVNRFFLDPDLRKDADFQKRFLKPATANTGVIRFGDDPDARDIEEITLSYTFTPNKVQTQAKTDQKAVDASNKGG